MHWREVDGSDAERGGHYSIKDKRRAVEALLADPEWSRLSDREISRRCGVSHPFVSKLRTSCSSVARRKDAPVVRVVLRNGTTFEMNVTKVGSSVPRDFDLKPAETAVLRANNSDSVYAAKSNGRIKVGFSRTPLSRVREVLWLVGGGELVAVAAGSLAKEREIHEALHADRDRGEWFVSSEADVIAAMEAAGLTVKVPAPSS